MVAADIAAMLLTAGRNESSHVGNGGPTLTEIRCQNSRSRSTRRSGGFFLGAAIVARQMPDDYGINRPIPTRSRSICSAVCSAVTVSLK